MTILKPAKPRRPRVRKFRTEDDAVDALVPILASVPTHLIKDGADIDVVMAAWMVVYTDMAIAQFGEDGAVGLMRDMVKTLPMALRERRLRYDPGVMVDIETKGRA